MTYKIKNQAIHTKKRLMSANRRKTGDDSFLLTKDAVARCRLCNTKMDFYKEDAYGDLIYSCPKFGCLCNKVHERGLTIELKKLFKQLLNNSKLYYRNYQGGYY